MAVTVSAGEINGARHVVRTSLGKVYVVLEDAGSIKCFYGGVTPSSFTQKDAGNAPSSNGLTDAPCACAIDSDDVIHVVYYRSDGKGDHDLYYCKFHTIDSTAGSDTWDTPELAISQQDSDNTYLPCCAIAVDSNDKPHAIFIDSDASGGTDYDTIYYANKTGAGWSSKIEIAGVSQTDHGLLCDIAINASNYPIIAYNYLAPGSPSVFSLRAKRGNANNPTAFTEVTIVSSVGSCRPTIVCDSDGYAWTVLAYSTSVNLYIYKQSADWTSAWTGYDSGNKPGTDYSGSLVVDGTTIYVFYEEDTADDIVYNKYDGSWLGETQLETTVAYIKPRARWAYNHLASLQTYGIDYVFDDGTNILWNVLSISGVESDTDLFDGKLIIKDIDTVLADGKLVVKAADTGLFDGKLLVYYTVTDLFDGKVVIMAAQADLVDGKLIIKEADTGLFDGKVIVSVSASDVDLVDGKIIVNYDDVDLVDGKIIVKAPSIDNADGKLIIKAEATDLLDGKLIIKAASIDYFDGKVVIKDADIDLVDGKLIVMYSDTNLLDGKIIIIAAESNLLDGLLEIKTADTDLLDGKVIVQLSEYSTDLLDGKIVITAAASDLADGKIIIKTVDSDLLDGRVHIYFSASDLVDGKIRIYDASVNNLDGLLIVKAPETSLVDGRLEVKDADTSLVDGKLIIKEEALNVVDGKLIVMESWLDSFDGKATIKDAATGLFDGKAIIKISEICLLDGKVHIQLPQSNINLFDGKLEVLFPSTRYMTTLTYATRYNVILQPTE